VHVFSVCMYLYYTCTCVSKHICSTCVYTYACTCITQLLHRNHIHICIKIEHAGVRVRRERGDGVGAGEIQRERLCACETHLVSHWAVWRAVTYSWRGLSQFLRTLNKIYKYICRYKIQHVRKNSTHNEPVQYILHAEASGTITFASTIKSLSTYMTYTNLYLYTEYIHVCTHIYNTQNVLIYIYIYK